MSVSLGKGGVVTLAKPTDNLKSILVGLGWEERQTTGADYDLDATAFLVGENGRVVNDQHFVFYGNLRSPDGSVEHQGDNLTGNGDGDDEEIFVDLEALSAKVAAIRFAVSIHEADVRRQSFGEVDNAYIRVVDRENGRELARYDLTDDARNQTAIVFGEVYRESGSWKFRAVGQGYASGLLGICREHGVNVA